MKTFLIIAFICVLNCHLHAQQNIIRWNQSQPLQWIDFAGNIDASSSFDAESFAEVKYNYTFISSSNFYFDVYASFNKNTSWCKKEYQSAALLKHEQLHFDIAELYAKRLEKAFNHFQYSKDFVNEITQLFNEKKSEYHTMQLRYDEETNHSLNQERQVEWEKFINEQLSQIREPN